MDYIIFFGAECIDINSDEAISLEFFENENMFGLFETHRIVTYLL